MKLATSEARLLDRLRGEHGQEELRHGELFARIAWSRLCEPGDRIAGAVIRALGAEQALNYLVRGTSAGGMFERIKAADPVVTLSPAEIQDALLRWRPRLDRAQVVQDVEQGASVNATVLLPSDQEWPTRLNDLGEHTPHLLWVRGNPALLARSGTAIVGARASSAYGEFVTSEFTHTAVQHSLTVISGAAYGIDAVAHRTALAVSGDTIAVLAGGIDRHYPAAHDALIDRIAEEGAVCAEVAPGTAPTRWRFLQRNRVIAALAQATLVTEAGLRSGSLNTARHASQLGRPLGAVPGPISAAGSVGCFTLIREYEAQLITNDQDFEALLGFDTLFGAESVSAGRQPMQHTRAKDALPLRGAISTDEVARRSGLSVAESATALTELELLGEIKQTRVGGGERAWSLR